MKRKAQNQNQNQTTKSKPQNPKSKPQNPRPRNQNQTPKSKTQNQTSKITSKKWNSPQEPVLFFGFAQSFEISILISLKKLEETTPYPQMVGSEVQTPYTNRFFTTKMLGRTDADPISWD